MILKNGKLFTSAFGTSIKGQFGVSQVTENTMVVSIYPGAAVYCAAVVNTEGMTQKQIQIVHLEDSVESLLGRDSKK